MPRRLYTVLWLFAISMFVYALLLWGVFRRVMRALAPPLVSVGSPDERWVPRPDEDLIFGISPSDVPSHIDLGGVHVPLSVLIAGFVTIQCFPFIVYFADRLRRRRRELNDECVECGYPITKWRGHCPGCGIRIGPG